MKTMNQQASVEPDGKLQALIEIHGNPDDGGKVMGLVSRFGACREDDSPKEAANRLASMALVLANIAAGHLRGRANGTECALGVDFIVEGGFAAAEFVSSVIGPLSWIQDRWERNLLHDVAPDAPGRERMNHLSNEKAAQDGYDGALLPAPQARRLFHFSQIEHLNRDKPVEYKPTEYKSMEYRPTDYDSNGHDAGPRCDPDKAGQETRQSDRQISRDLVSIPLTQWRRDTLCREAMEYPLFFSGTAAAAGLQSRVERAHLGQLLVHSRVDSAASLEKIQRTLAELPERRSSGRANGSPQVRADLVLCADPGLLEEAVAADPERLRGVTSLLWLVESAPAGEPPGPMEGMPAEAAPDFRQACDREIRRRINFTDEDVHEMDALNGRMAEFPAGARTASARNRRRGRQPTSRPVLRSECDDQR